MHKLTIVFLFFFSFPFSYIHGHSWDFLPLSISDLTRMCIHIIITQMATSETSYPFQSQIVELKLHTHFPLALCDIMQHATFHIHHVLYLYHSTLGGLYLLGTNIKIHNLHAYINWLAGGMAQTISESFVRHPLKKVQALLPSQPVPFPMPPGD